MTPLALPAPRSGEETNELRAAARIALRLYPGPVGELLSRELLVWDDFKWRFGDASLIRALIRHLHQKENARNGGK